ncbi:MAG: LysR family transcriptional regulator substrate-binding protein, partial [Oscillibacter sp.]|nr:LysR family transcriptional regulator substrate-binding protein [Oscillibacter sp.]
ISGRLTVGMPSYRSVCYLPRLLPRFGEKYPNAAIEVVENEVYSLQKALLAGAIDLVISTQPLQESPYDFTILGREQVYLAVPPYHPLNNTHRQYQLTAAAIMDGRTHSVPYFPLQDAADERFILLRPSAKVTTRDFLGHIGLTLCKEAGFMPKLTPHTSRLEFAVSMVLANQALTFVTDTYIKYGNIAQHPVYYRIRAPHRNIAVLYRAGHVFQPIERAFINEIRGIL